MRVEAVLQRRLRQAKEAKPRKIVHEKAPDSGAFFVLCVVKRETPRFA
jgi:hypothetical protein